MPRCAVCGQDNPGGFKFCGACGASLAAPARAPAEERRLVTVLFCDLVDFTARSDQADPEDVGALLRPYHTRLRTEIERLGGTLDKFIGDGVMAVFGAPSTHEDDPERAVRCALGMLAAIEELNQARPALDLAVRIGITSGEALVRPGAVQTEGVVGDVGQHRLAAPGGGPGGRGGGGGGDLPGDQPAVRLRGAGGGAGEGQGRPGAGVAAARGPQPHRRRGRPPGRHPLRRPPGRARPAGRAVPADPGRPHRSAGHDRRGPGGRQVPLRRRAGRLGGRPAGAGHLAPGPLPSLWRRDHLLGAGRDRQGPGRDPRVRPFGRGVGQAPGRP